MIHMDVNIDDTKFKQKKILADFVPKYSQPSAVY